MENSIEKMKQKVVDDYRNKRTRWIDYVVTCKFGDQLSFVSKRNKKTLNQFINEAVKYYMEHEFYKDYQLSKMQVKYNEERKACGEV